MIINGKNYGWTQPCCEKCWSRVDNREPVRLGVSYRSPERCAWCGALTESGIYKREDPRVVPYPVLKT